jgi:hypothetical protein
MVGGNSSGPFKKAAQETKTPETGVPGVFFCALQIIGSSIIPSSLAMKLRVSPVPRSSVCAGFAFPGCPASVSSGYSGDGAPGCPLCVRPSAVPAMEI